MKLPVRSVVLALGLTIAAVGCTDHQGANPAASANVDASTLKVVSWGPKSTKPGTTFNLQPDGNSGVFVELSGNVPQTKFEATLGGKPLTGVVASGKVVTGTIPKDYLATPGSYPLELQVPAQRARIAVGNFTVEGDGTAAASATGAPAASTTTSTAGTPAASAATSATATPAAAADGAQPGAAAPAATGASTGTAPAPAPTP